MAKKYKCRVEYLESTGTQYINLNYIPTDTTGYKLGQVIPTSNSRDNIIIGCRQTTNTDSRFWQDIDWSSSNRTIGWGFGTYSPQGQRYSIVGKAGTYVVTSLNYMNDRAGKVDGVSYDTSLESKTLPEISRPMYLFAGNNGGTDGYYTSTKIYFVQITEGNKIVRDFIPVLDNSGRPAMYDQVSGQLFYNQGSGEFTYGRQIIPVEYLESTGTQYIDTGLKGKNGYDFDYKFNSTRIDGTAYGIGGEWENGKSCYLGLIRDTNYFGYHYQNTNSAIQVQLLTANTDYRVQAHLYSGEQYYILNGTKSAVGTITGTFTSTSNMRLFSIYSSTPLYSYIKMYYCKIWDNGVLVRDFIPCIDENLTPFMFDKVHNTVYLNAGTGQFKVGPNVEKVWGGKKLRKKLALMLSNLKRKRPFYTEVEYLESSGTQYIDTGITGTTTTMGVDVEWMFSNDSGNMCIFSSRSGQTSYTFTLFWLKTSQNRMRLDANGQKYFASGVNTVPDQLMRFTYKSATGAVATLYNLTNGTSQTETVGQIPTVSSNNLYLFQSRDSGLVTSSIKMYYFKLYDGDTLLRDMIPVLDWDMTPCMYDKVSGQLFYNQGTGEFTYGREIHYVDYLESTGTQYIDTGYIPSNTTGQYAKMQYTTVNNGVTFGGMVSGNGVVGPYYATSSGSYWWTRWGTSEPKVEASSPTTTDTHEMYLNFNNDRVAKVNNIVISNSLGNISGNYPSLTLFRRNFSSGYAYLSGKVYKYQITEGDKLIYDFIPAIDKNGVGFMFDRVTHTIYDNAGTGAFKYPARQLEYLKSTGTEYIDTGIKFDGANTKIELKTYEDSLTRRHSICGDDGNFFYYFRGTGNWAVGYNGTASNIDLYMSVGNNVFVIDKNNVYVNGVLAKTYTASSSVSAYNVLLFNRKTSLVDNGDVTMYYCKIWNNGTLVRDYIPAFKDGVAGMWDKTNSVFYSNAGTGTFSVGKVKEPRYE